MNSNISNSKARAAGMAAATRGRARVFANRKHNLKWKDMKKVMKGDY